MEIKKTHKHQRKGKSMHIGVCFQVLVSSDSFISKGRLSPDDNLHAPPTSRLRRQSYVDKRLDGAAPPRWKCTHTGRARAHSNTGPQSKHTDGRPAPHNTAPRPRSPSNLSHTGHLAAPWSYVGPLHAVYHQLLQIGHGTAERTVNAKPASKPPVQTTKTMKNDRRLAPSLRCIVSIRRLL